MSSVEVFVNEFYRGAKARGYFGPLIQASDVGYGKDRRGRPLLLVDVLSIASREASRAVRKSRGR